MLIRILFRLVFGMLLFASVRGIFAVDLLYDFEDPTGVIAIDKLTDDGSQDGLLINNVTISSDHAAFGSQSALFDIPEPVEPIPPFSTLEIPDTTFGSDFSVTVAMHMENKEDELSFTRLFSTFQGTGPVPPDRSIFLDFDPTGASGVTGLRAIVNSTVVMTDIIPDGLADPGYHHYALTINEGDVSIFFDGQEVVSDFVGFDYSSDVMNVHIGEDPHDGGGTADEQLIGNFDEVLVIGRALSAAEIGLLADGNLVSSVVTPGAGERAVYYDFEGDSGTTITDKFTNDGRQNAIVHRLVAVDQNAVNAKLGARSAQIKHPKGESDSIFSQIDVGEVGNLGEKFTLSAVVNVESGGFPFDGLTRLFSSFRGTGPILSEELIFDFDPNASVADIGMRLVLPDGSQTRSDVTFSANEDHTLTAVYDDGDVFLYLDGELVAEGFSDLAGDVDLGATPLKIGEDNGGILNENFIGFMDDVLILSSALSSDDVASLAVLGAAEFLGLTGELGDFNNNGMLDIDDINQLVAQSALMNQNVDFDITKDGIVNSEDVKFWISDLKNSWVGDSNLDGEFNSTDLVVIFQAGKFELDVDANWAEGDWTGDARFNSSDLVAAFQDGGFEIGPKPLVAVPEPTCIAIGVGACFGLLPVRRNCSSRCG